MSKTWILDSFKNQYLTSWLDLETPKDNLSILYFIITIVKLLFLFVLFFIYVHKISNRNFPNVASEDIRASNTQVLFILSKLSVRSWICSFHALGSSKNLQVWQPTINVWPKLFHLKVTQIFSYGQSKFVFHTYRIVASRNNCYYSGNQKFCFLKSRLVTCYKR